jgi:CubicO group peptidase (beta-lactamase class C family)
MLQAEVARGFSGAVTVARGRTTLLDKAYGEERGTAMRSDTRFWIASAGKPFTSAAVLKCKEKGLLGLDDPISRFFPAAPPDKRAITVRQLLAHLSGFDQSYVSENLTEGQVAHPQPRHGWPAGGSRYTADCACPWLGRAPPSRHGRTSGAKLGVGKASASVDRHEPFGY